MTILSDIQTALFKPSREIGPYSTDTFTLPDGVVDFDPFTAQASVEETHVDELEITSHPVAQGASITDHSYKKPSEVILRLAWSNSGLDALVSNITALAETFTGDGEGGFNYIKETYEKLLSIQLSRIPINVTTGKRAYKNMLIKSLTQPNNNASEHALFITVVLQEVLVARVTSQVFKDDSVQSDASVTGAVQKAGTKQASTTAFSVNTNADGSKSIG